MGCTMYYTCLDLLYKARQPRMFLKHQSSDVDTDYIVESHILIPRKLPSLHYLFHKFTTSTMASVHFAKQTLAISPH